MRTRIVPVLVLAGFLAACDNFSEFGNAPPPDVITVEGFWEGTASTTSCTPGEGGGGGSICDALLALGEFPFELFLNQQDDRVAGTLIYGGLVAVVGGVVTEGDVIRLAGTASAVVAGVQVSVVVRSWSTDILGRGIAGSRMSGSWRLELTVEGTTAAPTVAAHTIVQASRTR